MDEFDDPEFDRLGATALDQVQATYPKQPVPQKLARPGFNAILVNARQKGNPVLNGVKNVPWEYGDIQPDFVIGATACALFLSLKYHRLHPEYIYNRIKDLAKQYGLRVMLVLCDIDNHSDALRELTKTCVVNNFTLILAWTPAEAGRYLETFKALETAPAKEIKGQTSSNYSDQLVDVLTSIRAVNKNDAYSLIGTFGSLKKAFDAQPEEIAAIGGWGVQKVKNFTSAINLPFSTKTGTSRKRQEEILMQASQMNRSKDPAEVATTSINLDDDQLPSHNGRMLSHAPAASDFAGVDQTTEIRDDTVEIADGTGAKGLQAGLEEIEAQDTPRTRKVNPEYQNTLDILAKMREASGYGPSGID